MSEAQTEQSPFAAPAQTAAAPAEAPAQDAGDTSYFDTVASQEPLIKGATVPGVLVAIEQKESQTSGNPFLNLAVQLYPSEDRPAVFDDGTPVPQGKRLQSSLFLSAKDDEKFKRTARQVKNFVLALRDVPLDGKEEATYKTWPATQKIGVTRAPSGAPTAVLNGLAPLSQWIGQKVLVQISKGKDMDGNPRNEFALLAPSTKAAARKGSS